MAIFHLDAGVISRGDGHSAVAAAAYRAGECIVETRTGEVHDYSRRSGVDHCEIIAPRGAPGWCKKRARLWNRAEDAERRADSQIARQIELALPRELSFKQRRRLMRRYVRKQFTSSGMVADIAYHDQDGENPHVHILLTMRRLAGNGFSARKERDWNNRECVGAWRSRWAHDVNAFLHRAGCRNRVDHRTLAAQRADALAAGDEELATKLDRAPGRHYGRAATAIQARADRVESAAWAHGEALRIGEADRPNYRYVAEPYVPSSRVADIQEAMDRENAERAAIRREREQLAKERTALEKRIADAARAAGLNDAAIDNIHSAAEAQEAGSGLEAVHLATKARVERQQKAEESARTVGVDVDSVSSGTRGRNTDLLKAIESATEKRQTEIKAEARAAGLDDETISKLYDEAEAQRTGSGWTAVESATAAQVDRRKRAERVARKFDVDIGNVVAAAGTHNDDPLMALESVILERWTKISTEADSRVGGRATTATTFPNGATVSDGSASQPKTAQAGRPTRHGQARGVRLFFVEEFLPYSWAFLPADASLQCSFRGDSNQASAYPRLSGGQPSLETVPNTVGLSPSGALPSGHSRGVLVRCRGKGGRPAMAVTTGFQRRTFDVPRTGVPCIGLPSRAPCAAADAVFADAKALLSSSEARQMSESELERELHRRGQD